MRVGPAFLCGGVAAATLAASPLAGAVTAEATHVLGTNVQLACEQPAALRLACEYRLIEPAAVDSVRITVRGRAVESVEHDAYDTPPTESAVLFLVDTSDPGRQAAVQRSAEHVRRLIEGGAPHHRFGLAAFDSRLRLLAPIGSPRQEVAAAAQEMRAVGMTTELYRSSLEAVRRLAAHSAERRALVLMSDGLAEDRAYYHDDVVRAAREAGVVVYGVGYPRSVALSVGLQSVRRLAEETGGVYVEADPGDFRLPEGFFDSPFRTLDNGGTLEVDLSPLEEALEGSTRVTLGVDFDLAVGSASARVPVELPPAVAEPVVKVVEVEVPKVVEVPRVVEQPAPSAPADPPAATESPAEPVPAVPPPPPAPSVPAWLMYAIGGGLLVVLVLVLLLVWRQRRSEERAAAAIPDSASTPAAEPARVLAFLERQDGSGERHPVTSSAFRIGRHSDNDLSLKDPSVSRQHAEIHRRRDGSFTVADLDSMNGIFVNEEKVKEATLSDGDLLEVGDMALQFTVVEAQEPEGEKTVALKTVAPVAPMPGPREKRA